MARRPTAIAWQSWWVLVPLLVCCFPLGLVVVWLSPRLSRRVKIGVTAVTAVVAIAAGSAATEPTEDPSPGVTPSAPAPASTSPEAAASSTASPSSPSSTPATPATPSTSPTPEPIALTDLRGRPRAQAAEALRSAGLRPTRVVRQASDQPRGTVLAQSPAPGAALAPGTPVTLTVAKPHPKVPAVVGRTRASAVRTLKAQGYRVTVRTKTVTSGRNGVVLSHKPQGRLALGSRVTLTVSKLRVTKPAPLASSCTPGYSPCLAPASDYDCAGGGGDGPQYVSGVVTVTGSDPYELDRDNNGLGCD